MVLFRGSILFDFLLMIYLTARVKQVLDAIALHQDRRLVRTAAEQQSVYYYSVLNLAVAPPSMTSAWPVIKDDCSLSARK